MSLLVSVALGGMESQETAYVYILDVFTMEPLSEQFRVSQILACSGLALSAVTALLLDKYRANELLLSAS